MEAIPEKEEVMTKRLLVLCTLFIQIASVAQGGTSVRLRVRQNWLEGGLHSSSADTLVVSRHLISYTELLNSSRGYRLSSDLGLRLGAFAPLAGVRIQDQKLTQVSFGTWALSGSRDHKFKADLRVRFDLGDRIDSGIYYNLEYRQAIHANSRFFLGGKLIGTKSLCNGDRSNLTGLLLGYRISNRFFAVARPSQFWSHKSGSTAATKAFRLAIEWKLGKPKSK